LVEPYARGVDYAGVALGAWHMCLVVWTKSGLTAGQAMTALSAQFRSAAVSSWAFPVGKKIRALAARHAFKAGIILGAAIVPRAQNACLLTDAERFLLQQNRSPSHWPVPCA